MSEPSKRTLTPWSWVPTLYMAEGLPYVIVMSVALVMYQRLGLSNEDIALYTSWLYLPWVIKPFWSPVVDLLRTKRWWIVVMQFLISGSLGGLAFTLNAPHFVQCSLAMLWVMAFSSATHDISADGLYMLALNTREQAFFVGIRSTFYRVASILGQGLLCMIAGRMETLMKPSQAWALTFAFTAALFLCFSVYHAMVLPRPASDHPQPNIKWSNVFVKFLATFVTFFQKKHIVVAMLFILLYRLPEALLVKICPLFLLGSTETGGLGLTTGDYGMVQGTLGVIGLTLGGILGGIMADHGGLKRWLWPMVLSITLPDAVYIALAYFQPAGLFWVSLCVFVEQFGYGFGFTAYMLYLIYFSRGELSTAHYAFCTGLMALGMMLPGLVSGYLQVHMGYLNFFIFTTALCVLTFIVAAMIKIDDDPEDSEAAGCSEEAECYKEKDYKTYQTNSHYPHPMKHNHLFAGLLLAALSTGEASAQFSLVNPVPQQITLSQGTCFDVPSAWNIKTDASRASSFAVAALKTQTSQIAVNAKAKFSVTLGVKGDKAVSKYASKVPSKAEGYWMNVSQKGVVIVGNDEEGLFYGVQSLLASMKDGKLQEGTVQDWPDVPFRGTVEGFYGTPWSHQARLSQIEFYGRNKMNVYIYGPKDDPYHRAEWRKAYPEADAQRIKELNEHAKANGVKFYWAIHPGVDIKWTTEDRDALVAKLEKMYNLGIRSYAVFFDDIWGEGAKADKQAELLNYVDENFIHKYKDVSPLIMCPTEYNRAWANDEKGYLRTLGTKMNKDVQIMWTGNSVVHCIDKESMEWINKRIDRKAYIWWNFPVSDFVRDHILLGPAYGNGLDIADEVSGFVSNPMEHAEASKISLYGIADYTWNMKNYDYQRDWERGLQAVLPSNTAALRTFALYSKDLGQNGHGFRREEGDELKSLAEAALKGDQQSINMLLQKSMELKLACDVLLGDKSNPELIRELRPWLLQGRNLADYGMSVCYLVLASNPPEGMESYPTFNDLYAQARSIQEQMYQLENSSVRHALQPGIKVGTTVMLPTLNKLFTQAVDNYNAKNGTALVNSAEYNPYKLSSDVAQLNLLPVTVRGNKVSVAPSNEVINWQKDGALLIEADRDITFAGMDFNLGVEGVAKNFKLELFSNGEWKTVSLLHYADNDPVIHTGNELGGMSASKLRLTNVSGHEMKVYFRSFNFVRQ